MLKLFKIGLISLFITVCFALDCIDCNGVGFVNKACYYCNATGRTYSNLCYYCKGVGFILARCDFCNGAGQKRY